MVINMLAPIVLYYISTHYRTVYSFCYDLFQNWMCSHNVIELTGTIIEDKHDVVSKLSPKLRSVIFYINQHCMSENSYKKLIEIPRDNYYTQMYNESAYLTEYLLDQDKPIPLTPTISCRLTVSVDDYVQERKKVKIKEIKASVYSDIMPISDVKAFVDVIEKEYNEFVEMKMNKQSYCFVYLKDDEANCPVYATTVFQSTKTFENLVLSKKAMLKKRLDFFINNEPFYANMGIPYTLGMLLYGLPGTGKTSTIKAIANYTNRHLIVIPMAKMTKFNTLRHIIMNETIGDYKIPHHKRLYVFEEIDCNGMEKIITKRQPGEIEPATTSQHPDPVVVNGVDGSYTKVATAAQKNAAELDKITLGGFLELIDGINEASGRILIMTTNKNPDEFDDALLRPGRIDIKMEFAKCNAQEICELYRLWFKNDIPTNVRHKIKEYTFSAAEIGEMFINHMDNPEAIIGILCGADYS